MQIFRNRRAWRLRFLLYFFGGIALAGLITGGYGLVVDDIRYSVLGLMMASIAGIAFAGVEYFAHNYVILLELESGQRLRVVTMSTFGDRSANFNAAAELSAEMRELGDDDQVHKGFNALSDLATAFNAGDGADQGGVKNSWCRLRVPGRKKAFMIDTTGDEAAGEALRAALAKSSARTDR